MRSWESNTENSCVTFTLLSPVTDTKPKFVLLETLQAKKPRDKLLGQGITTSMGKLTDREDGRLVSPKNLSSQSEFMLRLYRGRGGASGHSQWLVWGRAHCNANQWQSRNAKGHSPTVACLHNKTSYVTTVHCQNQMVQYY